MDKILCGLPLIKSPNLLVGLEKPADAGIYKLTKDIAIIQTVDYFTPIIDDPYTFGQIAVANALSDIYAMGGKPLTAMNIVCFPKKELKISVLKEIIHGGIEKMHEAGVLLLGGHTVDDLELKYGLAATGIVHPKKIVTNANAQPGDELVLTKPLGTGIIATAIKAGLAKKETVKKIVQSMNTLNEKAARIMLAIGVNPALAPPLHAGAGLACKSGVNACTDITGFGLLGHAYQMAFNSNVGIKIYLDNVPIFLETKKFLEEGLVPAGLYANRDFYLPHLETQCLKEDLDILFDPQTSGGLLISVPEKKSGKLLKKLLDEGINSASLIGEVIKKPKAKIIVE